VTAASQGGTAADGADLVSSERRGNIFLLGLNRPGKHNALDQAMVDQIDEALVQARREPCVLIVHSTSPGVFAAGADIAEMVDRDADAALRGINAGLFDRLEAHRWPSIAVIDGPAYGGGCELALACDLRIASPNARFAQPEPGLGIIAGAGANWRLPQTAGLQTARRMLYVGEVLNAGQALAAGLVDAVHPAESLLEQAVSLADRIATRSWRALELTKLALRGNRPASTSFDIAAQAVLFESEDKRQRMTSFLDDRARRRRERATPAASPEVQTPADPAPGTGEPAANSTAESARHVADPVPPFRVRQLTIEDGLDLASWSRPGAWHIEDALEAPEPDEGYWAVVDCNDTLLGFCCVGGAARVPGAPRDDYVVDVAIGIRPQLAGRGWSGELGRAAVRYAASVALDRRLRTTVPEWNQVGRHAAAQAGFTWVATQVWNQQQYEILEQTP
jgi:enoyl-CoA hydratase/carnithine racemase/RimJ/RimL family protein N-acetyltransferase